MRKRVVGVSGQDGHKLGRADTQDGQWFDYSGFRTKRDFLSL